MIRKNHPSDGCNIECTPFQRAVYDAVRCIPAGKVSTYAAVAAAIGCRSPRAVGQALKVNPFAPEVPCHRVITSALTLGGFRGSTRGEALQRKRRLLAQEGVDFNADGTLKDHSHGGHSSPL
ncbi:MAG TPA: methyltransferase [Verrucomicrobia bacterium]|nr:methyltransferase [Verrucomicrobiota bacterium]